jgi:hypothetical protein
MSGLAAVLRISRSYRSRSQKFLFAGNDRVADDPGLRRNSETGCD